MEAVYLSLVGKFSGVAILRTLGVNTLRRHFLVSFSNVAILAARSRCRGVGFIFPHSFSLHLTGPPHMGRCLHMGRRASAETFLNIFPDRPKVFLRCGDDCFCIIKKKKKREHLNSIESAIQFTMERETNTIPPCFDEETGKSIQP